MFEHLSDKIESCINFLTSIQPFYVPLTVFGLAVLLFLIFMLFYCYPSVKISFRLGYKRKTIDKIIKAEGSQLAKFEQIDKVLSKPKKYLTIWKEFKDSLHVIKKGEEIISYRATVEAQYYFTEQYFVENPLRTSFFRYIPGILTSIGIIGTFWGLMIGLRHFDMSTPDVVTHSVGQLLQDVMYAFLGSAIAIAISVIVTLIEKNRLSTLYKKLASFNASLDAFFKADVEQSYLEQIRENSDDIKTYFQEFKDGFANDINKSIEKLLEGQKKQLETLATNLSSSYSTSSDGVVTAISNLSKPLQEVVTGTGEKMTEHSSQLLDAVLKNFMKDFRENFSNEFKTLTENMNAVVTNLGKMKSDFSNLLDNLQTSNTSLIEGVDKANKTAREEITQMVKDLLAGIDKSSQGIENATNRIVSILEEGLKAFKDNSGQALQNVSDEFKTILAKNLELAQNQQTTFNSALDDMLKNLKTSLDNLFTNLNQGNAQAHQEINKQVTQQTANLGQAASTIMTDVNTHLANLISEMKTQTQAIHAATQSLTSNASMAADKFAHSVNDLTQATTVSTNLLTQSKESANNLKEASVGVKEGTDKLSHVIEGYESTQQTMQQASQTFKDLAEKLHAEVTSRQAFLQGIKDFANLEDQQRKQFLTGIKEAGTHIISLTQEVEEYRNKINAVLTENFSAFATDVSKNTAFTVAKTFETLDTALSSLTTIVASLSETVGEFEEALETLDKKK